MWPIPLNPHSESRSLGLGPTLPRSWGDFQGMYRIRTRVYFDRALRQLLPDDQLVSRGFFVKG
jgi:hypothetical protein